MRRRLGAVLVAAGATCALVVTAWSVWADTDASAQSCRCCTSQERRSAPNCCPRGAAQCAPRPPVSAPPAGPSKRGPRVTKHPSGGTGCPPGMLRVPGGTFLMGSPDGEGEADEHPQTRVTLRAFCLDRTEVTAGQYLRCVQAGRCAPAPATVDWSGIEADRRECYSRMCNGSRPDRAEHPVNCVDWPAADAYCRWSGGRLPTEAEWEIAARGAEGRTYPWGEAAPGPTLLNAVGGEHQAGLGQLCPGWTAHGRMFDGDDGWPFTAPVGSYPAGAGPYGHLDLAGNVWEWTADWYAPSHPGGSITSPRGPDQGRYGVDRGGSWGGGRPAWVRGANRSGGGPAYRCSVVGFRCARGGS